MRFEAAEALFPGASPPPRESFFGWAKALYLHERALLLPEASGPRLAAPSPRLRRFLTQAPFDEAPMLRARLAEVGLDPERLEQLLDLPADELARDIETPAWVEKLIELYRDERSALGDDPVATLISPFIEQAKVFFRRELGNLFPARGRLGADLDRVVPSLLFLLGEQLNREARRSVVLELHACRELGLLSGSSGQERLHDFSRRLATPHGAFELFDSFPLLGRRLCELQERFFGSVLEMLGRLVDDLPWWLELLPAGGRELRLVSVKGGLSDPHRGGRGVHFLIFEDGRRLVYKPKRLAAELGFGRLLDWLAGCGFAISLRALRVVDREDYGWAEMVERQDVRSEAEVRDFYRRQGAFLALLHALQAVDFHHENLIAAGAYPVLIDLECLFHPQVDAIAAAEGVGSRSIDAYLDTVHTIGFLPQQIWDDRGSAGLDISGLGAAAGRSPQTVARLIERGTDEMRIGNEEISPPDPDSTPRLQGLEVKLEDYCEDLLGGFSETYRFLMRHRRELLAPNGPIEAFAAVEQRVLLRATTSYVTLLGAASHPQILGDALDADLLFDRLWSVLAARPFMRAVLRDEREALLRGDVPLFTAQPGRRDVVTCSGRRYADFFAETGLERVRRRVLGFSEEDLAKQSRIIAGALESVALSRQSRFWPQHHLHEKELEKPSSSAFLAAAEKIAGHLETLEVRRGESSFFFAQRPTAAGAFSYDPVSFDLYRGQAGIALFDAQLFAATGERRWAKAARRVLEPVLATFEVSPWIVPGIGAFGGWAGIGYTLERMAFLLGDPHLARLAAEVPGKIASLLDQDTQFDVLGGAAGAVLYLLRRSRLYAEPGSLELALKAGDHLLAHSREEAGAGRSWAPAGKGTGLAGLSHGSGGIAWALFELAAATGAPRFAEAARAALRHERSLFRPAVGNWVDLRTSTTESARPDTEEHFLCAWCHGAVGIGLARLRMLPLLQGAEKAEAEAEIGVAVGTALLQGFGASHCLCHGDLGTLDFLLEVAAARGESVLGRRIDGLAAGLLESLERDGWRCGLSHGVEQPGLFVGLAGIGYGLLRLADPVAVPSVLALAGP